MLACRRHDRCRIVLLGIRHFPLAARRAGYITAADVIKCRDAAAAARRKPARRPLNAPGGPSGCGVSGRRARNDFSHPGQRDSVAPDVSTRLQPDCRFSFGQKGKKQAWLKRIVPRGCASCFCAVAANASDRRLKR